MRPAEAPVRRLDLAVLAGALALVVVAGVVGRQLLVQGRQLFLGTPPLLGVWHPHVGWGTPLALLCLVAGLRLQRRAAALPWHRLLLAGWLLDLAWLVSLALVDGFRRGWADVLLDPNEYLHDLPRIRSAQEFLATFTRFIAFSDTVDGTQVWTTHVAGHPPLATLVFWALDRAGLPGGAWAGLLCVLVGSSAAVALPVTVRALGAPGAARRLVPFAALFPGAVYVAVSADGLFAGVATSGLALATLGATRAGPARLVGPVLLSAAGGLLLGAAVFLSYGLVLFGVVVLVPVVLTLRRGGRRDVGRAWLVTTGAALALALGHLALGFNWFTGLAELRVRYYQGIASVRPYSYFVWANPAAWLVGCSPFLAVGLARAASAVRRRAGGPPAERSVGWLALAGLAAALLADLSALSKAETERIWLAFGMVAATGLALVRGRAAAWALLGCGLWALLLNSLVLTGW